MFCPDGRSTVLGYNTRARKGLVFRRTLHRPLSFSSLLTPDSPRLDLNVAARGGAFNQVELRFAGPNGQPVDALCFVKTAPEVGNDHFVVVCRDISESKQKELDLLRFSNVVHYTVNPIQITDARDGWSTSTRPSSGRRDIAKEELIGNDPSIISSRKYRRNSGSGSGSQISAGKGLERRDREPAEGRRAALHAAPDLSRSSTSMAGWWATSGSHRDVTEQQALEQQLMHSQKMESIGTLAAGIAHEVGNPLASISSIVQVLQRTITDDFARDKLGLVQSQVHRITKIIRDLVDFSRPSNYQVQPTDLVKVLTDAVEIVKMGKKAKEVTFYTHVRHQIPLLSPRARSDRAGLHQYPPECRRCPAGKTGDDHDRIRTR